MKPPLLLTGYDDNYRALGEITTPSKVAYAQRWGMDFERIPEEAYRGSPFHPSWHKVAAIREHLVDRPYVFWMDADTVVTNMDHERAIPDGVSFIGSQDWCAAPGEAPENAPYFSCGNFIAVNTPQAFDILGRVAALSHYGKRQHCCWEQDAFVHVFRSNPEYRKLAEVWPSTWFNAVDLFTSAPHTPIAPSPWTPGDTLVHLTSLENQLLWAKYYAGHELSLQDIETLTTFIPEWWESGACMDRRHILWLARVVRQYRCDVVEVGSHTGASASGILHGLCHGAQAHFVDPTITDGLRKVTSPVSERAHLHAMRGVDFLKDSRAGIVFLDGAHDLRSVAEELDVLLANDHTGIIAAHDTRSSEMGLPMCEGPAYLRERLTALGWTITEDHKDRPCERTARGLLFAINPKADTYPIPPCP